MERGALRSNQQTESKPPEENDLAFPGTSPAGSPARPPPFPGANEWPSLLLSKVRPSTCAPGRVPSRQIKHEGRVIISSLSVSSTFSSPLDTQTRFYVIFKNSPLIYTPSATTAFLCSLFCSHPILSAHITEASVPTLS